MILDPHRTYPCRCRKCGGRKRIASALVNTAVCERKRCGGTMRIDRFRDSRENTAKDTCWCLGYSFPHHVGRGYCDHNPKLTPDMLREREESGSWA